MSELSSESRRPALTAVIVLFVAYASLFWAMQGFVKAGRSDFIIYYTAAQMARSHVLSRLYDLNLQIEFQDRIMSDLRSPVRFTHDLLPYNHPPFQILWFMPLAGLPYLSAFSIWVLWSVLCFALGILLLTRSAEGLQNANVHWLYLLSFLYLPLLGTLLQGQDSAMLFLFWVLAYRSLKRSREGWAGFWLSLLLQKFQILLPVVLVLSAKKRWKAMGGFLGGRLVMLLISFALVGASGLESYIGLLKEMSGWVGHKGIYPSQMHNLRGQIYLLWYDEHPLFANILTIGASLVLLAVLLRCWNGRWDPGRPEFDLKFSLLVITSLLVSPHLNFHDASLMLLPGLLIWRFAGQQRHGAKVNRWLVYAVFTVTFPVLVASFIMSLSLKINLHVLGLLCLAGMIAWTIIRSQPIDSVQA